MSFLSEVHLDDQFGPFVAFQEARGFVPNLLRAQTLLPRVIEAQTKLGSAVLLQEGAISRIQKEQIILIVAAARRDIYCVTAHCKILSSLGKSEAQLDRLLTDYHRPVLSEADLALLDFFSKLSPPEPPLHPVHIQTPLPFVPPTHSTLTP